MNIVAVIPAHNEVKTIRKIVREALYTRHVDLVIVVDDGSVDGTGVQASREKALVIGAKGLGYDGAIGAGFRSAAQLGADIIITLDGDGEHDPNDIPRMVEPIISGRADIVCGERPYYAHFSEAIFAFYTGIRFGISDPLCGFKAYRREVYDAVGYFDRTNSIGTELMLRGARKGYRVVNVPIRLHPRQDQSRFYSGVLRGNLRILRAMVAGLRFV